MSDLIRNFRHTGYEPPFLDEQDSDPDIRRPGRGVDHTLLKGLMLTPENQGDILDLPLRGKEEAPPPGSPYYKQYMLDQYLGKIA